MHLLFLRLSFPTHIVSQLSLRCFFSRGREFWGGGGGGECFLKGLGDSLPPSSHRPVGNEQSLGFQTHLLQCRLSYSMLLPIEWRHWCLVIVASLLSVQFSSIAQSCQTLCDPMNRSKPGLPVHHHLPEFIQTHVHRVSDAIQLFHPLSSPFPPALNPSQHQSFPMSQLFTWGAQSTGE